MVGDPVNQRQHPCGRIYNDVLSNLSIHGTPQTGKVSTSYAVFIKLNSIENISRELEYADMRIDI